MEYIVKGVFIDTPTKDEFRIRKGELLIKDGIIHSFSEHFENKDNLEVFDYGDKMIIPGFSDLHLHAPQYEYCGNAMDVELLTWLEKYTFPAESRYKDIEYAKKSYRYLVRDLVKSITTRVSVFATIHTDSTIELMNQLEEAKIAGYIGKLQMDRNAPEYYLEKDGVNETIRFINECEKKNYKFVKPILTPRFTPSVTDKYMEEIGKLASIYHLPMQSHLSENLDEIAWVKSLRPMDNYYYESYYKNGLFGGNVKTIMAHCIYSSEEENKIMKENSVYIAHCPTSNINVIAGLCPAAYYLRNDYHIGLGSDVAGGHSLSMFEVMKTVIQVSKIRYKYVDNNYRPLTLEEVFYMGTKNGGSFFGKVGSFEEGYEFDACVMNDDANKNEREFSYLERLERMVYLEGKYVEAKFVKGEKLF